MSAPASPSAALTASAADVVAWLRTTFPAEKFVEKMDAYAQAFTENGIDGATMSGLDKDDLVHAGIDNGIHRSQIMTKWNLAFGGGGTGAAARAARGRPSAATARHCIALAAGRQAL